MLLDKSLGLAAIVDGDVELGVLVALVPEALEVAAVAEQVERQAESQHAQHQQAHVHLKTKAKFSLDSNRQRQKLVFKYPRARVVLPRADLPPGVPPWP